MKSTPSFASGLETTVANNMVSPILTVTEPSDCLANFPVSIEISFPPGRLIFSLIIFIFLILILTKKGPLR